LNPRRDAEIQMKSLIKKLITKAVVNVNNAISPSENGDEDIY